MKKILLITSLFLLTGCSEIIESNVDTAPSLSSAYRDYFDIGVAVTSNNIDSLIEQDLIHEFDTFTAEYEMKWNKVVDSNNQYNYSDLDKIINFAIENEKTVRGHTLIWRTDYPSFIDDVVNSDIAVEDKISNVLDLVTEYYTNINSRYNAVVNVWDVANEIIEDNNEYLYRYDNIYFKLCNYDNDLFEQFIADIFIMVNEVSPNVSKYYNDYFLLTDFNKRNKVITFINNIRDLGAVVDGVGMQSHITTSISKKQVDDAIKDFKDNDLKISFTELDISIYEDDFIAPTMPFSNLLLSDYEEKLAMAYNHVFAAARENKDIVDNITFWGIYDKESWLVGEFYNYRVDFPLLFDENYNKKKCYYIVKDFELYLGGSI